MLKLHKQMNLKFIICIKQTKYWNFVQELMRDKEVTDFAGIGLVLGKQLKRNGFEKAFVVFGKFLLLKKNKESFVEWIREITKANLIQAGDCYQCLFGARSFFNNCDYSLCDYVEVENIFKFQLHPFSSRCNRDVEIECCYSNLIC